MVDKINIPQYLFSKDGVIPAPPLAEQIALESSIYSSSKNTIHSASSENSIFENKSPAKFDFSGISEFVEIKKPRKKIIAPPSKKTITETKPTTTEPPENTAKEARNKDLEELQKFTSELKALLAEVQALQAKGKKVDVASTMEKYLATAPTILETDKKVISNKPTKDGGKKVITEGVAADGSRIKTESSFNNNGELINELRIHYIDDGKIEIVKYIGEKNNTKDNDPSTKRGVGLDIKFTDENGIVLVIGKSEVYDKKTNKLEILNWDYRIEDEYHRTRKFFDEKGNYQGANEEYGNFGGIGIREVTNSRGETFPAVVTSNLHLGNAQEIPLETFNQGINFDVNKFTIDNIEKSIFYIERKGKKISETELSDLITVENGVTYTPKATTYELREELPFGKTRIDYFTKTEIHSTYIGFGGEIKEYANPEPDTIKQGVKYVVVDENGTEKLEEDANVTYRGGIASGIIIEQSATKTQDYSYINEKGEEVNSQLHLTSQQNFNEHGEYTTIKTTISDVMERTQYTDSTNPENNSDNITFLQDGSIIDLATANYYTSYKM